MQGFGRAFSLKMNLRRGLDGSIFKGRFGSQLVQYESYLTYLLAYIHLNPLKASLITKVDAAGGWTSHRQYMGREKKQRWLQTRFFNSRLGGRVALEKFVLSMHRGKHDWPNGLDPTTGWINWLEVESEEIGLPRQKIPPDISASKLLEDIGEITGASYVRLQESIRGPKGNPERKFAVWALSTTTSLTHSAIGGLLAMTSAHVSKEINRGLPSRGRFEKWKEEWLEKYPVKCHLSVSGT